MSFWRKVRRRGQARARKVNRKESKKFHQHAIATLRKLGTQGERDHYVRYDSNKERNAAKRLRRARRRA